MPVIQKATAIATAMVTATIITVAITGLMPFLLGTRVCKNRGFYSFRLYFLGCPLSRELAEVALSQVAIKSPHLQLVSRKPHTDVSSVSSSSARWAAAFPLLNFRRKEVLRRSFNEPRLEPFPTRLTASSSSGETPSFEAGDDHFSPLPHIRPNQLAETPSTLESNRFTVNNWLSSLCVVQRYDDI
jgi:hypothetical protein